MSIAMDIDDVERVLIAGTWYKVLDDSFGMDSYEYIEGRQEGRNPIVLLAGGEDPLIPATGFYFKTGPCDLNDPIEVTYWMCGPMTSIQAVRYGTRQTSKETGEDPFT